MAFRLGIIGAGRIAQWCILPALLKQSDFELSAIWDVCAEARRAAAGGMGEGIVCESEQALWGRQLDAVYIGTPNASHQPLAVAALRNNCAVLVEKPLCLNVAQADAIVAAAKAARRPAMVAYMSKLNVFNAAAAELVRSGQIGELLEMRASFGFTKTAADWRSDRQLAGFGAMGDVGIYPITTSVDLFGEMPLRCRAHAYPTDEPLTTDLHIVGLLEFAGERRMSFESSFFVEGMSYTLLGTKGVISVRDSWAMNGNGQVSISNKQGTRQLTLAQRNPYVEELAALACAMRGGCVHSGMTIARGRDDVRVMEALYQSSLRRGAAVELKIEEGLK